jgi:hypothetical protein
MRQILGFTSDGIEF